MRIRLGPGEHLMPARLVRNIGDLLMAACFGCGGSGKQNCRTCGGSGQKRVSGGGSGAKYERCTNCGGSGTVRCPSCGGSGRR